MYTCEAVLKTTQDIGESGGISRNQGEIGEIGRKLGNCILSMGRQNSLKGNSISPRSKKKGENEEKQFHKNSHLGNLSETVGGNEREFRFHHKFQLHITVALVVGITLHTYF